MKILVVGGGGREHAIVWKISQSGRVTEIICAPGNAGIAKLARCVSVKATDLEGICDLAEKEKVDMVVIGPDDPLALGMADMLRERGIRTFGPSEKAAIIESSKVFSKNLMKKYNIPTAKYEVFENSNDALDYLQGTSFPTVIKAEGLALGKGVIIAENLKDAEKAVLEIMEDKKFGSAGNRVVIEEFLTGQEISVLAFTDGETVVPMCSAQDHKRALDNDKGLNTGGMGAFSPSRIYDEKMAQECMEKIFVPTVNAMKAEGRPFAGVLYFGLMSTREGVKVIEYNARFGDPETQVVLPRLQTDIVDIFEAVTNKELSEINISWSDNAAVCVIAASGGYPGEYETGYEILGTENVDLVFHSGTSDCDGKLVTAGGRVLGVTAVSDTLEKAIAKAYDDMKKISFKNMHYRQDIGRTE